MKSADTSSRPPRAKSANAATERRLRVEDWVNAAVTCMLTSGADGVRVERLAKDLHVTKGSFYWHFRDRAALLQAVLRRWEQITINRNTQLAELRDPEQRLLRYLELPEHIHAAVVPGDFEVAIRAWGRGSAEVSSVIDRVDRLRDQMLVQMFRQLGARGRRATALAQICRSVAGRCFLDRSISPKERHEVLQLTYELLRNAAA